MDLEHERHMPGNTVGRYPEAGGRGLMWIVCPRAWLAGRNGWHPLLVQWQEAGYPSGVLINVNQYDWILSPDPGCELP